MSADAALTMSSRERFHAALSHREPDRVPLDLGSTSSSGISATAYRRLLQHLGIEREIVVWDRMQQLAVVDEEVLRRLGIDTRGIWPGGPDNSPHRELADDGYEDEWRIVRRRPEDGLYYDLVHSPLAGDITISDIRSFPWPDPADPGRTRGLRERAERIHRETSSALVLTVPGGFMTTSQYLRGFEDWYVDIAIQPELLGMIMDHTLEFQLAVLGHVLAEVGEFVDAVMVGDDIGTQNGPMVSPSTYRKHIKPRQARVFERIHSLTRAKVLYHTCGAVSELIDDLIEIGVDVLNPVQVAATGMDSRLLKTRFGDRISFWGGVDTQRVMPTGTTDEVRAEVRRRIRDLAPGGGYVCDTVHNIQADVPPENIVAMYEEAARVGRYPLRLEPEMSGEEP